MSPPNARGPVRGIFLFLISLFLASGVLRLTFGFDTAEAVTTSAVEPKAPEPAPQSCPTPPAEVLSALQKREARAETRDRAIEDRMAALSLVEATLTKQLEELAAAEAKLSETLARADGAAEQDLTRLTAVYEAMKPPEAAALFERMAPEFASGFLGRMRPDAAAAVLSGMSADAGYKLSLLLASRNALVPTE